MIEKYIRNNFCKIGMTKKFIHRIEFTSIDVFWNYWWSDLCLEICMFIDEIPSLRWSNLIFLTIYIFFLSISKRKLQRVILKFKNWIRSRCPIEKYFIFWQDSFWMQLQCSKNCLHFYFVFCISNFLFNSKHDLKSSEISNFGFQITLKKYDLEIGFRFSFILRRNSIS